MQKYTLKQIMKMWKQLYGENFKTEYSGFYNLLKLIVYLDVRMQPDYCSNGVTVTWLQ